MFRRKSVANTRHFVKIGTNRTSHIWSCHSTESHSRKQQGPRGFDGNTNTTCDSIKEAVIKKEEQHAVSPIVSSYWGLALLTSGIQGRERSAPGSVLQPCPRVSQDEVRRERRLGDTALHLRQ